MNIIIYGSTFDRACNKLEEIIRCINEKDIKCFIRYKGHFSVELYGGTLYIALGASNNARGYRWHKAYIDKTIDTELLNNVVLCKFATNIHAPNYYMNNYEWFD